MNSKTTKSCTKKKASLLKMRYKKSIKQSREITHAYLFGFSRLHRGQFTCLSPSFIHSSSHCLSDLNAVVLSDKVHRFNSKHVSHKNGR